jgi:hypothetical protein
MMCGYRRRTARAALQGLAEPLIEPTAEASGGADAVDDDARGERAARHAAQAQRGVAVVQLEKLAVARRELRQPLCEALACARRTGRRVNHC